MKLQDVAISRNIIRGYFNKLTDVLQCDVAVAGAGPSGMIAAFYLAQEGVKVTIFEKRLSPGGGVWGGGMMFNVAIVQESALPILDDIKVGYTKTPDGYYAVDTLELGSGLCYHAAKAGVKVMNLLTVEDVMMEAEAATGLVLNWTAVDMAHLHVDPLVIGAKNIIDATGHDCCVARILERKGCKLLTETGGVIGEKIMHAETGEMEVVSNTKEFFPNIYASGMAANAVFGGHRMGPIFGGMLLSGQKTANLILQKMK